MTLSIGILGTGAIGTLMAWHWRQHNLYLVQRTPRALVLDNQSFTPPQWQAEPLDWLLVTTKAADSLNALRPTHNQLSNIKRILLLQNGVGQQEEVQTWLTHQGYAGQLWVGTTTEAACRNPDTSVHYTGKGQTWVGSWNQAESNALLPEPLILDHQIKQRLFHKLAINAVINPLTAVHRCLNGELLTEQYWPEFQALASEVETFYKRMNWPIGTNFLDQVTHVAQSTAKNTSSTLQDILNQRPTELPYISGYLLKEAKKHKLSLHLTQQLYSQLNSNNRVD